MRYDSDRLVFSPSDLVVFLDSEFASWMDRWRIECSKNLDGMTNALKHPLGVVHEGFTCKPDEQDAESRLIATMGMAHESAFLRQLIETGHGVEDIKTVAHEGQVNATIEAMRNGTDFIYQGRLKHGSFEGLADFLVQLPGDSLLGTLHTISDCDSAEIERPHAFRRNSRRSGSNNAATHSDREMPSCDRGR